VARQGGLGQRRVWIPENAYPTAYRPRRTDCQDIRSNVPYPRRRSFHRPTGSYASDDNRSGEHTLVALKRLTKEQRWLRQRLHGGGLHAISSPHTQFLRTSMTDQEIRSMSACSGVTHYSNTSPHGHGIVSRLSLARWEIAAPYSRVKMPYRRSAHLRVKRADADRLHARTVEMAALTFQRVADGRQRAVAAALLVQQCRARVRSAMWLSRSG